MQGAAPGRASSSVRLVIQNDGVMCLQETDTGRRIWEFKPKGFQPSSDCYVELQHDGQHDGQLMMMHGNDRTLVSDREGGSVLEINHPNLRPVVARVQDDRCLVLYDQHGIVRWSSAPTDYVRHSDYVNWQKRQKLRKADGEQGRVEIMASSSTAQSL